MSIITKITRWFTKKRIIWTVVGLVVLGGIYYIFFAGATIKQETVIVHPADFLQQVSVSGKVSATENVDLSFEQGGIVRGAYVKVGDSVYAGKFLASQDTAQLSTQLAEMQAGIDLQKAKLAQLLAGASPENVKIAQDSLASAKQNMKNAYDNTLFTLNSAYNYLYGASTTATSIQNTYFSGASQEGLKVQSARFALLEELADVKTYLDIAKNSLVVDDIDTALVHIKKDLNLAYNNIAIIRDQCDSGVFYSQVTVADKASLDTQKTNINTALTSIASAQQSISSYSLALKQAQNQLDLVLAPSRDTDIAVFKAQISQAEASAQNVLTQIRKRQIFSPITGIVTLMDAKVGSNISAGQIVTSVISSGKFQIESYVPEIYIALVKIGNDADVTLDSFGSDKIFHAKVVSIDPSETIKDGVSTYKIALELDETKDDIRDGMTANVIITTEKKSNTISVLQGAVSSKDGKKFVKVKVGDTVSDREVVLGEFSSSGYVEIVSGLQDGDTIVIK